MLEKDIREITNIPEKEMIFQKEEEERFDKETKCWICNGEFNYGNKKVNGEFNYDDKKVNGEFNYDDKKVNGEFNYDKKG